MDNTYISKLKNTKRTVGKKIYAAVALLLIAVLLFTATSYAWLLLATAPEITGVSTTVGANGSLEIALATKEHLSSLQATHMVEGDTEFVMATGDPVHDNVLWGNLIDLTAADYGLHVLNMRPALLNILDGVIADLPLSIGSYGIDGRMKNIETDPENLKVSDITLTATYSTATATSSAGTVNMSLSDLKNGNFDASAMLDTVLADPNYGVRVAGPLDFGGMLDSSGETANIDLNVDGYCFAVDMLFRTNATSANLMLQTEAVQRMESDYAEEYMGGGSFLTIANPALMVAANIVFADTLTGEVYALAKADADGNLWITARPDESGKLVATADNDAALIRPLIANEVAAVTAWVYLDGTLISNKAAAVSGSTELKLNLQFSTDAVLDPAYTDKNTEPSYPTRPEIPTDAGGLPSIGEKYVFGSYEQDNNLSNGAEPIEWRILAHEGNNILLISTHGLDAMAYNPSTEDVTWESSSVRTWLNSTFINSAFTTSEQSSILTTYLANDGVSTHSSIPEGNSTNDKIFFLSESEALSYFDNDEARLATATAYAIANGAIIGEKNITCWWTRTPGAEANSVTLVCGDGAVSGGIYLRPASNDSICIRPAMWITLDTETDTPPDSPDIPDVPVIPELPTDEVYYLSSDTDSKHTIYTVDSSGARNYEVNFKGSVDANTMTFTITRVTSCEYDTVVFPSKVYDAYNNSYSVIIDTIFTDVIGMAEFKPNIVFLACDGQKVGMTGTTTEGIFWGHTHLVNLDLSGLDTSGVTDMYNTFYGCSNLAYLNLSGLNTSSVTNMSSMFRDCTSLTSLNLSGFDTANVTDMRDMFTNCSSLTSLDVSNFDTSSVTNMSNMFRDCSRLTSLDVSKFDTANVTDMSLMFSDCSSLISLDVSKFDTANVTDMSLMFSDCSSLNSLDVSKFDTAQVTDMGSMFRNCTNVTALDLSGFDMSTVIEDTYNYLYGCSSLHTITTPKAMGGASIELPAEFYCSADGNTYRSINADTPKKALLTRVFSDTDKYYITSDADAGTTNAYTIYKTNSSGARVYELDFTGYADASEGTALIGKLRSYTGSRLIIPGKLYGTDGSEYAVILGTDSPFESVTPTDVAFLTFDGSKVGLNSSSASTLFGYMEELKYLDLSGLDTTDVTDMSGMFFRCRNLISLDISGLDTSKVRDMSEMFHYCDSLASLNISGMDTSKVTDMYSMFSSCGSLTSLDLSSFDTSNVVDMNGMFSGCSSLPSIDVSGFDTTRLTNIHGMFSFCSTLTELDLSGFDTSNLTAMGSVFTGCTNLSSVDLSGFDTSDIYDMSYLFFNCSSLKSVDLSDFDTSKVTNMNFMFAGCSSLTAIDLSGFNTSKLSSASNMFKDCSSLTTIDLSTLDMSKVTTANLFFGGCSALSSVTTPKAIGSTGINLPVEFYCSTDGNVYTSITANTPTKTLLSRLSHDTDKFYLYADDTAGTYTFNTYNAEGLRTNELYFSGTVDTENGTVLISKILTTIDGPSFIPGKVYSPTGDTAYSVVISSDEPFGDLTYPATDIRFLSIENQKVGISGTSTTNLFSNKQSIIYLDLSGLDTSNITDMSEMFSDCRELTELHLDGLDTSNVTNMSNMFRYCYELTSLDVSGFNTDKVTDMGHMFELCSALQNLELDNFNTQNVTDMERMFSSCYTLTQLDLTSFNTARVTNMSHMFSFCTELLSIDMSSFNTARATNMSWMFYQCEKLPEISLDNFETGNVTTMRGMFYDCRALRELDVSGFDTSKVESMYNMFSGCETLTTLDLSTFDVSNVCNMNYMFSSCYNLRSVDVSTWDIGNTVNMLYMFAYCSSLESIDMTYSGADVDYWLQDCAVELDCMFKDCTSLTSVNLHLSFAPSQSNGNIFCADGMFSGCTNLSSISAENLSLSVSSSKSQIYIDTQSMFLGCSNLSEVDLSGIDLPFNNTASMFANCGKLATLDLRDIDMLTVTDTTSMFSACTQLTKLTTPKTIGSTSITLPARFYCSNNDTYYTAIDSNTPVQTLLTR